MSHGEGSHDGRRKPRVNPRRRRLWEQDPRCFYCKCELTLCESTIDHVVPKSKGGSNHVDNLVLCCKICNNKKGNMSKEEFLRKHVSFVPAKWRDEGWL